MSERLGSIPSVPATGWQPDRKAIRIHLLAAEPNAVLALMKWCTEGPVDRIRMTGYGSPDLLVPPPLRERLELSRS
ncbi:hypothetical protein HQO42_21275 [Rhodococcus fascians]|nr:hypothetical protein [Rhodococcus fascians]MBY4239678.1 hypothetical protein [Rhodococcus fascians]MBY4255184.1 hypothetical protein [Rhodococcus fascians]MBY4271040.1 hypothetical protein [Rhodococcus fascians]